MADYPFFLEAHQMECAVMGMTLKDIQRNPPGFGS